MILAKDVLTEARYILSDTAKDRWSDVRLLKLLSDGLRDIAKNTTIFTETMFYVVANLAVDIDFTANAVKIVRAEYLDDELPFYSFDEMDEKDPKWQLETGDKVKAIVYDKQRTGLYKLYPIVSNAQNYHIEYNQLLGVTTDISYSDILPVMGDSIGDIGVVPDDAVIKFYYIRKHDKVTDINTQLDIDDLFEIPLAHYVAGMALRDNQDAQNRQMAAEELQLYYNKINEHSIEKSKNFSRPGHTVRYNPMLLE